MTEARHRSKLEFGTSISRASLVPLEPVLRTWAQLNDEFLRSQEDPPWTHIERANVSIVAGAAWRLGSGWVALEEFGIERESKTGRCDLYLARQADGGEWSFACEFKRVCVPISASEEVLKGKLKAAADDAGRLDRGEADQRLGATFLVPLFDARDFAARGIDACRADIESWIETTRKFAEAVAWFFPAEALRIREDDLPNVMPGVSLVIQEV